MPVAMLNNPTEEKVVMRIRMRMRMWMRGLDWAWGNMTVAMLNNPIEEKVRWDGRQDLRVKSGRVCF